MEAIILLGGPGAGKGTQAELLKSQTRYLHVSTGDMLRAAIRAGSPVGIAAKKSIDAGELVSDEIILRLIEERIALEEPSASFMFDGFPRTIDQAEGLARIFKKRGGTLNYVFNLCVDRSILLRRLTGRRVCKTCGAIYHIINKLPAKEGLCDLDGGELYQRADDCEATILNRLDVYEKQTAPLIAYYREKGLLRDIEAGGTATETDARVLDILKA
jgi:adenylate kinase